MLYEAIKDAEPVTPISSYRATENRLRRYERLRPWPESFVVLGDAACAFNPVYGQGMTTAALASEELRRCLNQPSGMLDGVAGRFQRHLARINRAPWMLATSEDLRFRSVEGGAAGRGTRWMHRYIDGVLRSATRSVSVRKRFLEVQGMLKGPAAIFRPSVLFQAAKELLRGNSAGAQQGRRLPRMNELAASD